MKWGHVLIVCALGLGGRGEAEAGTRGDAAAAAARLAHKAEQHAARGELHEALAAFRAAARLEPGKVAYRCNTGLAYYSVDDLTRAHLHLSRCLALAGTWPAGVGEVFTFVARELERRRHVAVTFRGTPADADITIAPFDEHDDLRSPATVHLPPGEHAYSIEAPGHEARSATLTLVSGMPQEQRFELQPSVVEPQVDRGVDATVARGDEDGRGGDRRSKARGRWGWISVGGGSALLVGGGVAYLTAINRHARLEELSEEGRLYDGGELSAEGSSVAGVMQRRERVAFALAGIGAAAVGLGAYLLVGSSQGGAVLVGAAPRPSGGVVSLTWTP